jgi:hypothetical protein
MRQSHSSGSVEGVMGNHDSYSDSFLPAPAAGALVLKNPNLPFPPVPFTKLRGREGLHLMRSKLRHQ